MALPILRRGSNPVPVRRGDNTPGNLMSRVDPWNDFAAMDRLFDTFFPSPASFFGRGLTAAPQASEPSVELYETADDLLAFVYAPGMAQDSFDISASADTITIKGERKPLLEVTEGLTSHTPWGGLATGIEHLQHLVQPADGDQPGQSRSQLQGRGFAGPHGEERKVQIPTGEGGSRQILTPTS